MNRKQCTKCNKEYPATTQYFQKQTGGKFGLRSICKLCANAANRARAEAYHERAIELASTRPCVKCGKTALFGKPLCVTCRRKHAFAQRVGNISRPVSEQFYQKMIDAQQAARRMLSQIGRHSDY